MAKVLICSKLPNGLIITNPHNPEEKVTLAGRFSSIGDAAGNFIDKGYSTTEVDADFWAAWKEIHAGYKPLKNGSLFEAKSRNEAGDKAKELGKEKTGFEPMGKSGDARAKGVKEVTKE
jgi:hypothetical protein